MGLQLAALGALQNLGGLNLTDISTDYPVLQPVHHQFTITEIKVEPTKSNPNNLMMVITVETSNPALDKDGKEVKPGYKLTHRIGLTPTTDDNGKVKRSPEMIFRDIATLLDAVFGETVRKSIDLATFDAETLVGQSFTCLTSIEKSDQYGEQTRLARFIKKAA